MVRARDRDHLSNLQQQVPAVSKKVIRADYGTDYPFRIIINKAEWTEVFTSLADDINYGNFKDEAHAMGDREYDEALHSVWARMWSYGEGKRELPEGFNEHHGSDYSFR